MHAAFLAFVKYTLMIFYLLPLLIYKLEKAANLLSFSIGTESIMFSFERRYD